MHTPPPYDPRSSNVGANGLGAPPFQSIGRPTPNKYRGLIIGLMVGGIALVLMFSGCVAALVLSARSTRDPATHTQEPNRGVYAVTPTEPATVSKPSASPRSDEVDGPWITVHRNGRALGPLLDAAFAQYTTADKKHVVYIGATWCDPCRQLKRYRHDPRMVDAFAGSVIVVLDADEWHDEELDVLKLSDGTLPVFFAVDAHGKALGPSINGGAWGDNIPENMAPPLKRFFRALK